MDKLKTKLREKAIELLESKKVDVVIGWGESFNPTKTTPVFVRGSQEAAKLVFNPFCLNNLAVYLPRLSERAAIFTKPCEAGSMVALLAEGKINRDNLYIVGVACRGVIDPAKLKLALGDINEATQAYLDGADVVVRIGGQEKRVAFSEVVLNKCLACDHQDRVFCDEMIGDPVQPPIGEIKSPVPEDADALWWRKFWMKEFSRCTRCYACREACPACYCRDSCSAQSHREKWTGTKQGPKEALMFHALRAVHVAGRCLECGACEKACPVGIPLTLLHSQVGKAVEELFDFKAGESTDKRPPLETFKREGLGKNAI